MRWKAKDPFEWHRWFAWHPVTIDGARVWLETVERREMGLYYIPFGGSSEFRLPSEPR